MNQEFINGLTWYIVFLFSTIFHEASHAFLAMKLGDKTAYNGGQVSLNPIPHIKREPFGTVIIPILTYYSAGWMIGWASTPFDPAWAYKYPKKSAAMSAGGPIANFILLFISAVLIHIGIAMHVFIAPEVLNMSNIVESIEPNYFVYAAKVLSIMFSLNLILFIFNLLPIPPLDGSGILPLYLNDEKGRKYMNVIRNPRLGLFGIFIAWKLFDLIYFRIHLFVINILYPGSNYH